MTHFFRCFWAVALALGLPMAGAQTRTVPRVVPRPVAAEPRTQPSAALPVPIGSGFTLRGLTLQGQVFGLSLLRGRVVLIHYWATDCAVCLDKMADLRRRAEAWQGQRFSVVYVQMDKQLAGAQSYWQMVGMTQRGGPPATVLWRRDAAYRDSLPLSRPTTLPFSVLLNPEGRVVTSVEGRIPPQIWAQVAEQLR